MRVPKRWAAATLTGIALTSMVVGCGAPAIWGIAPTGVVQRGSVRSLPAGDIIVVAGRNPTVTVRHSQVTLVDASLSQVTQATPRTDWIPVLTVPTLAAARSRVHGTVTVSIPVVWENGIGRRDSATLALSTQIRAPVPSTTRDGGVVTLWVPVQLVIIEGRSESDHRETITVATGLGHRIRWGRPDVVTPQPISAFQHLPGWFQLLPGGSQGEMSAQARQDSLVGTTVAVQVRYTDWIADPAGSAMKILVYTKDPQFAHMYMEPIPVTVTGP